LLADGAETQVAHIWYRISTFPVSASAGSTRPRIICTSDVLRFTRAGEALTLVLSTESSPALDGEQAWGRGRNTKSG